MPVYRVPRVCNHFDKRARPLWRKPHRQRRSTTDQPAVQRPVPLNFRSGRRALTHCSECSCASAARLRGCAAARLSDAGAPAAALRCTPPGGTSAKKGERSSQTRGGGGGGGNGDDGRVGGSYGDARATGGGPALQKRGPTILMPHRPALGYCRCRPLDLPHRYRSSRRWRSSRDAACGGRCRSSAST